MKRLICWLFGHPDWRWAPRVSVSHVTLDYLWECRRCGFHFPDWFATTQFDGGIVARLFRGAR